jgi:hypothetical protein
MELALTGVLKSTLISGSKTTSNLKENKIISFGGSC